MRDLRGYAGLHAQQLGGPLGSQSRPHVRDIELKQEGSHPEVAHRLARALGVTPSSALGSAGTYDDTA